VSQIGDTERAFQIRVYSKTFEWLFATVESILGEFWANHLKLCLQLNHVPVHKTHSAKVIQITTTSVRHALIRIVPVGPRL
jgi:hypothetical protein